MIPTITVKFFSRLVVCTATLFPIEICCGCERGLTFCLQEHIKKYEIVAISAISRW